MSVKDMMQYVIVDDAINGLELSISHEIRFKFNLKEEEGASKELTQFALQLSIAKWVKLYTTVRDNQNKNVLAYMRTTCPLCMLFNTANVAGHTDCAGCPIFEHPSCTGESHQYCKGTPYDRAYDAITSRYIGPGGPSSKYTAPLLSAARDEVMYLTALASSLGMINGDDSAFIYDEINLW